MPLPNRVTPFADLMADTVRGLLMGNRGGRIHDAARKLGSRRWASKQWICCVLDFKGRQRKVWGNGYTESGQSAGDGNGFKLGGVRAGSGAVAGAHVVEGNVAFGNKMNGFDENGSNGGVSKLTLNNNTAYKDHPHGPAPRELAAGRIPDTPRHRFINRLLIEP